MKSISIQNAGFLGSKITPAVATFSDDYTTNSGWTQTGSWTTITGGVANFNGGNNANHNVRKSLGITLSNSQWVWTFKFYSGVVGYGYQILSSGTSNPDSNNTDWIGLYSASAIDNGFTLAYGDSAGMVQSAWLTGLSNETYYWIKIVRESPTSVSMYVYSNESMTTLVGSRTINTLPSTVQNLSYIWHGSISAGGGDSGNSWTVDDTKIYNGVTSI